MLETKPNVIRPLILHITGDYPDPTRSPTTVAIKRLIDGLTECDHIIFSLTRTADRRRTLLREIAGKPNQRLVAIHHFGLPFGVGLYRSFKRVAHQIEAFLAENRLEPNIVHSHRLTFDGLAGAVISASRRIPHFVSIRGEVESKVLRFKPAYRPLVRQILLDADKIYYVSAWFKPQIEHLAGPMPEKSKQLPNIVANTRQQIDLRIPNRSIVTVANLDIYRKKGIDSLIAAFASVADRLPDITLEIIGGGSSQNVARVARLIAATGLVDRIVLRGAIANSAFLDELPHALALALPSRNETFGMVYTEALFAGVPILYGRGTGIDGHLDGLEVGPSVQPGDVAGIAVGLIELVERNGALRHAIAAAAPELFARFDPERQIASYLADVAVTLGAHAGDGALPA